MMGDGGTGRSCFSWNKSSYSCWHKILFCSTALTVLVGSIIFLSSFCTVHCLTSWLCQIISATSRSEKILGMPRIEPDAAGWEAFMQSTVQ